jgi:hypothetical protein
MPGVSNCSINRQLCSSRETSSAVRNEILARRRRRRHRDRKRWFERRPAGMRAVVVRGGAPKCAWLLDRGAVQRSMRRRFRPVQDCRGNEPCQSPAATASVQRHVRTTAPAMLCVATLWRHPVRHAQETDEQSPCPLKSRRRASGPPRCPC